MATTLLTAAHFTYSKYRLEAIVKFVCSVELNPGHMSEHASEWLTPEPTELARQTQVSFIRQVTPIS